MENRINNLFGKKNKKILSVFFTAGFPGLNDTARIIRTLADTGVDMIEVGIPFSDPLADGFVIQRSSEVALKNGMTLKKLFEQLKDIRKKVSVPLLFMSYLNPVFQFGVSRFCKLATGIGIDGLILPDLPVEEYCQGYQSLFRKNNLRNIFLITPQTSSERIKVIDKMSDAFIYVVSSSGTTGTQLRIGNGHINYFKRIHDMKLSKPLMIGFGISDKKGVQFAARYSNGTIIGSAFIKMLSESSNLKQDINSFISSIKN